MKEETILKIKREKELSTMIHNSLDDLNLLMKEYGEITKGETKLIKGSSGYSFVASK
jgi:hypothetical protein